MPELLELELLEPERELDPLLEPALPECEPPLGFFAFEGGAEGFTDALAEAELWGVAVVAVVTAGEAMLPAGAAGMGDCPAAFGLVGPHAARHAAAVAATAASESRLVDLDARMVMSPR